MIEVGFGPGTGVFVVIMISLDGKELDGQRLDVIEGVPGLKVMVTPSVVRMTGWNALQNRA
ncbi:hypothetical protein M7I_4697 [Glarea lozoyensis 74030]|uniref:Uncharacterized protein n=1 Tax=Glarea lozoyensis (strain ATCC 74030 / MF5533) TaxID=1104152 RepID=H0EPV9_GLAL7|nr:hypothetical protein M7I_4697 [Glarea lozoyensis 74030]